MPCLTYWVVVKLLSNMIHEMCSVNCQAVHDYKTAIISFRDSVKPNTKEIDRRGKEQSAPHPGLLLDAFLAYHDLY